MNLISPLLITKPERDLADTAVQPIIDSIHAKDKNMLLYEDLSRHQHDERQQRAAQQRMANRLLAVRRWERLAGWAAKRAARLERG